MSRFHFWHSFSALTGLQSSFRYSLLCAWTILAAFVFVMIALFYSLIFQAYGKDSPKAPVCIVTVFLHSSRYLLCRLLSRFPSGYDQVVVGIVALCNS